MRASVMMATDPVMIPANSFRAISSVFETIERAAPRVLIRS